MSWIQALAGAGLSGLVAAAVPEVVARLPEPLMAAESAGDETAGPTKRAYVDIARLPGLRLTLIAISAACGAALANRLGLGFAGLMWAVLVPFLLALAVIDWITHLLPTRLVLPLTGAALAAGTVAAAIADDWSTWRRAVLALVVVRTVFWLLWWIRRAGMGFGDVRLAALLGFALGWVGTSATVIGVYAAFIAFVIAVLVWLLIRRDLGLLKAHLPFGPFLVGGALCGVLGGEQLSLLLGYAG